MHVLLGEIEAEAVAYSKQTISRVLRETGGGAFVLDIGSALHFIGGKVDPMLADVLDDPLKQEVNRNHQSYRARYCSSN